MYDAIDWQTVLVLDPKNKSARAHLDGEEDVGPDDQDPPDSDTDSDRSDSGHSDDSHRRIKRVNIQSVPCSFISCSVIHIIDQGHTSVVSLASISNSK